MRETAWGAGDNVESLQLCHRQSNPSINNTISSVEPKVIQTQRLFFFVAHTIGVLLSLFSETLTSGIQKDLNKTGVGWGGGGVQLLYHAIVKSWCLF